MESATKASENNSDVIVMTPLATTESVARAPSTSISGTSPPKMPASSCWSTSCNAGGPRMPSPPRISGTSQKGSSRKCSRAGTKRRNISRGLRMMLSTVSRQPGRPLVMLLVARLVTGPIRALHLGQARGCTLEGKRTLALGKEGVRRRIGRDIKLHPRLVESVDQHDQPLCRIVLGGGEPRHAVKEKDLELRRQRKVIGRSEGLLAKLGERGPPDLLRGKGNSDAAPMDRDRQRRNRIARHFPRPGLIHAGPRARAQRREIAPLGDGAALPVIGGALQLVHIHVLLQQFDKRQEELSVQTTLIKLLGRDVRGGDHDDTAREQRLEKPAEDHCIGNIRDLEFIKAKQRRLFGDLAGDGPDRVRHIRFARDLEADLDLLHEGMKMDAPPGPDRRALEEKIHQHRLAAPDAAIEVKPGHVFVGAGQAAAKAEPAKGHLLAPRRVVIAQTHMQKLQLLDSRALRRIGLKAALLDELAIARHRPARHVNLSRPLRIPRTL